LWYAAAVFREFWGDKAELRRFKDGSILEAVVWEQPAGYGDMLCWWPLA
jgi:U3 small nucleolar RNA-associated protein 22